jgi:hypothetical protein
MTFKSRLLMTATERTVGRYLRAPDGHSTAEAPAPEAPPAPAESVPVAADTDDFAQFEKAEKIGDVDSPAPEAGQEETPAPEEPTEGEPEEKKGKSVQERIDELTAAAREKEREAAELQRIINDPAALQARLAELGAKSEQPPEPLKTQDGRELLEGEPNPDDYEYGEVDAGYIRDSATFHAEQAFARKAAQEALTSEFNRIDSAYEERAQKAVDRYPDFEEKVVKGAQGPSPTWKASPVMALAMKTSEVGPDVAYHLANNPKESDRIAALSPLEQAREMGRLEGKFEHEAASRKEPTVKTVSEAPKPPSAQARGNGGKFKTPEDTDDFESFDRSYKSEASGG